MGARGAGLPQLLADALAAVKPTAFFVFVRVEFRGKARDVHFALVEALRLRFDSELLLPVTHVHALEKSYAEKSSTIIMTGVLWIYDTFENNFGIKQGFLKYF